MDSVEQPIQNQIRKLWCHQCKYEFEQPNESLFECIKCKNDFCEQINNDDDPRKFIPFGEENNQRNTQQPTNNTVNQQQNRARPNQSIGFSISINSGFRASTINDLIANLFPVTAQRQQIYSSGDNIDNIIDFIMRNDRNVYGTPPAAQTSVESLQRIYFDKEQIKDELLHECAVCKEDFKQQEEVTRMPCQHIFHQNCLLPWLKLHNSCPTCRYELPTDNQDYERRKQNQRS